MKKVSLESYSKRFELKIALIIADLEVNQTYKHTQLESKLKM